MEQSSAETKNILVVIVGDYHSTGVISYLENHLPLLKRNCHCSITLFVPGAIAERERANVLLSCGISLVEGKIAPSSNYIKKQLGLRKKLNALLDSGGFDVLHVNTSNRLVAYEALRCAKRHSVPVRIAHSHSSNASHSVPINAVGALYRKRIVQLANNYLACSRQAGIFLFGEKVWDKYGQLVLNGIDCARYSFSDRVRGEIRALYADDPSAIIYGYVGRLREEKQPLYAIEVFEQLVRDNQRACMWIVGDGPLMPEIKETIIAKGLQDKVRLFGVRYDVDRLFQGMDALLMPSLREGLGISVIEAQASGIPCFVSEAIPKSAHIEGCRVTCFSRWTSPVEWADCIRQSDLSRDANAYTKVITAGYDISQSVRPLEKFYGGNTNLSE